MFERSYLSVSELPGTLDELIQAVRVQGVEGLVAKRRASKYESGERSGA